MKLKILFLVVFLALAGLIIKFGIDFNTFEKKYAERVYPNVYIDNQNFGGYTRPQIVDFFNKKSKQLNNLNFTILYKDLPVATFSAQSLGLKYDGETAADQAYLIGRTQLLLSKYLQKLLSFLKLRRFEFQSVLSYDENPVTDFISQSEDQYNTPAENALFKFEGGRVTSFKQEKKGVKIDSDQFLKNFENNIKLVKNNKQKEVLALTSSVINPEITLASSNTYGIEEEIAVGKSDYSHSIPQRIHNVILAASKFNGVIIPKGDTFSFDNTVGDISSISGYQPAYIIKDGKTVLGDGGGVCQVSTTLFRAALNAGLPIIERNAHAYRVGYYENDSKPGLDATVFSPSVDLKFKNDTPASILIETEVDEAHNLLYFHFYGKKDGRTAQVSNFALWDIVPAPPPMYQDDPTLKKGVIKQTDFAAAGAKASFNYKVVDASGKTTIDQTFYSNYQAWKASYLVGTAD